MLARMGGHGAGAPRRAGGAERERGREAERTRPQGCETNTKGRGQRPRFRVSGCGGRRGKAVTRGGGSKLIER